MSVAFKYLMMTLVMTLMTGLMSCQHLKIVPIQNNDHAVLNESDVVMIMRKAGFDDSQILDSGTDVRNGLAQYGGIQLKSKNFTQAIYAIKYPYVHGTSRTRGSFTYNLETGEIE